MIMVSQLTCVSPPINDHIIFTPFSVYGNDKYTHYKIDERVRATSYLAKVNFSSVLRLLFQLTRSHKREEC